MTNPKHTSSDLVEWCSQDLPCARYQALEAENERLLEKAREWAIVVREADKQWSQPLSTLLEQLAAALAAMQEAKP